MSHASIPSSPSTAASSRLPSVVLFAAMAAICLGLLAPGNPARAQAQGGDQQLLTQDDVIAGTMDIQFNTRTSQDSSGDLVEGSPAMGVSDIYRFTFSVAQTTEYEGSVTRQPNLYTKLLHRRKQGAA